MRKKFRRLLRKILKILTRAVIKKHDPTIIALVGESGTAVPREVLYQTLHQYLPTRQNIESPEAEFVVPLTVIGADHYPENIFEWLKIILITPARILFLPSHSNILILEMTTGLSEILNYWLEITQPEFLIICNDHPNSTYIKNYKGTIEAITNKNLNLNRYKNLALKIGNSLGLKDNEINRAFTNVTLPEPRIRLLLGRKGNFVVDATYKYFPPLKQSLDEILQTIPGRKVWVRSQKDWENAAAEEQDVLVILGPRKKLLHVVENASVNPLET